MAVARAPWLPQMVAVLAGTGVALSVWLTYLQYSASQTYFCLTGSGCDIVRLSPYAYSLGIPRSVLGVGGYSLILLLALMPLSPQWKGRSLYFLTLAGTAYSLYLTYLQVFVINALCSYCLASAGLMVALFALVLFSWPLRLPRLGLATASGVVVGVVLLIVVLLPTGQAGQAAEADFRAELAQHLSRTGAVMYGTYWCPYCQAQKEWFGPAFKYITYVECDPRGPRANPELCAQKGVRAYPTWEIKGKLHLGAIPLKELAGLSGYRP